MALSGTRTRNSSVARRLEKRLDGYVVGDIVRVAPAHEQTRIAGVTNSAGDVCGNSNCAIVTDTVRDPMEDTSMIQ